MLFGDEFFGTWTIFLLVAAFYYCLYCPYQFIKEKIKQRKSRK